MVENLSFMGAITALLRDGGMIDRPASPTISVHGVIYSRGFRVFLAEGGETFIPSREDLHADDWRWRNV